MVTGGEPARSRNVLSWSMNGRVVASVVLGTAGIGGAGFAACGGCGPTMPPIGPEPPQPVPTVVADAGDDQTRPPEPPPDRHCDFVGPRARGARKTTRIVGGTPAPQNGERAFPFAAAVATGSRSQYCTASIVADHWALTAAHCHVEVGDLVLVGSTDLRQARSIGVAESRIHARFNAISMDNDVAVVRLMEPAGVPTVPLATGVTTLDATVIGWGRTSEGGATTQHLREATIPLWESVQCRGVYSSLTANQVCAGRPEGGVDSCQGDSGGPLLTWGVAGWEQLGITSYGIGCARPGVPGVYTDVRSATIRDWVIACTED